MECCCKVSSFQDMLFKNMFSIYLSGIVGLRVNIPYFKIRNMKLKFYNLIGSKELNTLATKDIILTAISLQPYHVNLIIQIIH